MAHSTSPVPEAGEQAHGGTRPSAAAALTLGALGIVFGDIGTSPLYAFQECVTGSHGVAPQPENILGVLSLIFWSLTMVVTVKYLSFLMRADNHGEGGIMALLALVPKPLRVQRPGRVGLIALCVIAGASLLFGDGIITPAISVLSALEGMEVATPALKPFVVPATCAILAGLFLIQRRGTGAIGTLFGPVMLLWFLTILCLGVVHIVRAPEVLAAVSPHHALRFFAAHGAHGFRLLGSVVLVVTGGEALYADMGHFGRHPIRRAWLLVVFPALLCCYFGQGALLLHEPQAAGQLFYSMAPRGGAGTWALVLLATAATIIASQALISGVFSLTHQAIRLGLFPRLTVRHTSGEAEGQIYLPLMNWGLAILCIALVLVFQHSSRLAAAYGLAVSGTMGITSFIYFVVTRHAWGWSALRAGGILLLFLSFDLPFLGANLLKFFDGGYLPVAVGAVFFTVMVVWRIGRSWLGEILRSATRREEEFLPDLDRHILGRVPGVAVVMSSYAHGIPPVLCRLVQQLRVVHEHVVLLTVTTEHAPAVPDAQRIEAASLGRGFHRVLVRYGFIEDYDLPRALSQAMEKLGVPARPEQVLYLLAQESFLATDRGNMGRVSESIFAFLARNARKATDYFGIPPDQVLELGAQHDL